MVSGHYCICVAVESEHADNWATSSTKLHQAASVQPSAGLQGYCSVACVLPPCPSHPADQGFLSQVFPVQTGSGA